MPSPRAAAATRWLLAGTSRPFSHCGSFAPLWVKSCQARACTGGVGAELETGLRELGELGLEQEPGGRLCGQDSMWCSAGALPVQPVGSGRPLPEGRLSWWVLAGAGRGLLSVVVSVQRFLLCSPGEVAAVRAPFTVLQASQLML